MPRHQPVRHALHARSAEVEQYDFQKKNSKKLKISAKPRLFVPPKYFTAQGLELEAERSAEFVVPYKAYPMVNATWHHGEEKIENGGRYAILVDEKYGGDGILYMQNLHIFAQDRITAHFGRDARGCRRISAARQQQCWLGQRRAQTDRNGQTGATGNKGSKISLRTKRSKIINVTVMDIRGHR